MHANVFAKQVAYPETFPMNDAERNLLIDLHIRQGLR